MSQPSSELIDAHARAAAALIDLPIDDAWWPEVVRHLTVLMDQARLVERHAPDRQPSASS